MHSDVTRFPYIFRYIFIYIANKYIFHLFFIITAISKYLISYIVFTSCTFAPIWVMYLPHNYANILIFQRYDPLETFYHPKYSAYCPHKHKKKSPKRGPFIESEENLVYVQDLWSDSKVGRAVSACIIKVWFLNSASNCF